MTTADSEVCTHFNLSCGTPNGHARAAALQAAAKTERQPAALVNYASAGRVLVVGPETTALQAGAELGRHAEVRCVVLVTEAARKDSPPQGGASGTPGDLAVIHATPSNLTGYLGQFRVTIAAGDALQALQQVTGSGQPDFDLVLDLTRPSFLQSELLPPGYFAPGGDVAALQSALQEIPGLIGEFEKPQYFRYNASICAHGRSGITACTRCLEACPTDAITSAGDAIEVNASLCQGAGSCATACPTGAITYNYPQPGDSLQRVRTALRIYRDAGGTEAVVLFHDGGAGAAAVAASAAQLPENIIPLQVEECGSVGMDIWLAALAWGAAGVVLLAPPQLPPAVSGEIEAQLVFAGGILDGMGYPPTAAQCLASADNWTEALRSLPSGSPAVPADFAPLDEKRSVIRLAVDHLFMQAPSPRPLVSLPAGAPFGEVWVDTARCTLCMACVSQCPASALLAGDETPQLKFIEANCVQCGLCCRTCPEDAIAASPRMLFDVERRRAARVLFEEEPFCCIHCGKPFATRSVITRITKQLQGHAMFAGDAVARIKMCEDCRVKDLYADNQAQEKSRTPGGIS